LSTLAGALVKTTCDAGTAAGVAPAAVPAAAGLLPEPPPPQQQQQQHHHQQQSHQQQHHQQQQQQQQQGQLPLVVLQQQLAALRATQQQQDLLPEQFQQLRLHLLQQQLVATLHKAAAAAPGLGDLPQPSGYQTSSLASQQAQLCLLQMLTQAVDPGSTPAAVFEQHQQPQQPHIGNSGGSSSSAATTTTTQWLLGRLASLQMLSQPLPPQPPPQQRAVPAVLAARAALAAALPHRLIVVPAAPSHGRSLSGHKRSVPELSLPSLVPAQLLLQQQHQQPQPAKRAHLLVDASASGLLALPTAADAALHAAPVVATQESAAAAAAADATHAYPSAAIPTCTTGPF
jgi:hypothetical protein